MVYGQQLVVTSDVGSVRETGILHLLGSPSRPSVVDCIPETADVAESPSYGWIFLRGHLYQHLHLNFPLSFCGTAVHSFS
jgi:hypothetical protein